MPEVDKTYAPQYLLEASTSNEILSNFIFNFEIGCLQGGAATDGAYLFSSTVNMRIYRSSRSISEIENHTKNFRLYAVTCDTSDEGVPLSTVVYVLIIQDLNKSYSIQLLIE